MRKLVVAILIAISISSCAISNNVTKRLPLPSEPVERPTEQQLECVSDETYEVIVKAYKRIETLENIIKSTY